MGRLRRSTWGIVAFVTVACGGKTDILDETGPDGGVAGGSAQGAGGTSPVGGAAGRGGANGSTGRGGAAGRGGTAGGGGLLGRGGSAGIPGSGASAGLGGGSGGAVTGGVGGAGAVGVGGAGAIGGSAAELIEAICRHNDAHGCGGESCRSMLRNGYNTNETWGCGDEWLGTQSCRLGDPTPCDNAPFCSEGFAIHEQCIAGVCLRGNHPGGGCVIGCKNWRADCQPSSIGLVCTCGGGSRPSIGFETSAPCQSEEWLRTVRANCE